jgi:hypothetical protein
VERIDASDEGRVEVAGRWFGVRGRRFVRPTLTLTQRGNDVRALADLEHKPWAAEDGEVWMAAFSVAKGLDGAREIELSVAPDIVVGLRPKGKKLCKPGDTLSAGTAARAPRFKDESVAERRTDADTSRPATGSGAPPGGPGAPTGASGAQAAGSGPPARTPRRRPSQTAELERLGARLAAANQSLEQERERRAALAKTLEDERNTNRQLRTELGQARSELEVAATARAEATTMEEELDAARRELREVQRRHEEATQELTRRHAQETQALSRRHDEVTEAHAALQDELRQHAGALESTREALAAERAEAGRLRNRLTQAQGTRERGATPPGEPPAAAAEPRVSRRARSRAAAEGTERRDPDPSETQRFDVLGLGDQLDTITSPPPTSERLRPLNPSLRHRTWWFGRLLALIVLCGVIAAVWVVLHSTVLH